MAAFRSASQVIGTGTDATPSEPAGAAEGDFFLGFIIADASGGLTLGLPSGWSSLYSGSAADAIEFLVGWILRGASAPDLTFTTGSSIHREVWVLAYSDVSASGTIDSQSASGAVGDTAPGLADPPSTTAVGAATLAICGGARWNGFNNTLAAPTNYTLRTPRPATDAIAIADRQLASSGAENPSGFTTDQTGASGGEWNGFTITLTPAAASAGLSAALLQWWGGRGNGFAFGRDPRAGKPPRRKRRHV